MQSEPDRLVSRIVLAASILFFAWAARAYLLPLLVDDADTWAHLALVRRTLERGIFPGDEFISGLPTPASYSLAHVLYAGLSRLAASPAHEVYLAAASVVAALSLLSWFVFFRSLSGDERIAAVAAPLEVLYDWSAFSLPRGLAIVLLPLCWTLVLRALRRQGRFAGLGTGLAFGACASLHLFVGGLCFLGVVLLVVCVTPSPRARTGLVLVTLGVGALLAAPWLANFAAGWGQGPPIPLRDAVEFRIGTRSLRVFNPATVTRNFPPTVLSLAALGLLACSWRRRSGRAADAARFAAGATVFVLPLLATPLYGILGEGLGAWTPRLIRVLPIPLLAGLGLGAIFDWRPQRRFLQRVFSVAASAGLALAVARPIYQTTVAWAVASRALALEGPAGGWNMAQRLAASGPLPEVVLSDPLTSYRLPYLLGADVVVLPLGQGGLRHLDRAQRMQSARRALSPSTVIPEVLRILDRYGVDAIVFDPKSSWPDAGAAAAQLARLTKHPAFVDTSCCGALRVLYRPRREPGTEAVPVIPVDPSAARSTSPRR